MSPEEAKPFRRVGILGLGLMGGSLARALAARPAPPVVVGWSPVAREREQALAAGAVSEVAERAEGVVDGADLVVLATPLAAARSLAGSLARSLSERAVLTDLVSLKRPMLEAVATAGLASRWVGAHPMCGGEASGFGASRAELYAGAHVWLVVDGAPEAVARRVEAFWRALGAVPERTDADIHDHLMVLASHLPQLTANALARVLADADVTPGMLGPGGRDMTRLAASSPAVWRDLLANAPDTLADRLRTLAGRVRDLADLVESGDAVAIEEWMAGTRSWRSKR